MGKRQFFEFILKVLNFLLILSGLVLVVFGAYHLIRWNKTSEVHSNQPSSIGVNQSNGTHTLSSAWFLILFIAVGTILFVISCFGYIGTAAKSLCCLYCYTLFMAILVLSEIGLGAFIVFDHRWKEWIPKDKTGKFYSIYAFIDSNWQIMKWVALGAVILEVMALLLAFYMQLKMTRVFYDSSEDEFIMSPDFRKLVPARFPASGTPSPSINNKRQESVIQLRRA